MPINPFEEFLYCQKDFVYFVETYVYRRTPESNVKAKFQLYDYQKRLIKHYEENEKTIFVKFRQGGFTSITVLYALWKCMFYLDEQILVACKTDREARHCKRVADYAMSLFPEWLKPKLHRNNKHEMIFATTDSRLKFQHLQSARGTALTHLIIEEAAFIPQMHEKWQMVYPLTQCGCKIIVMSTPNDHCEWFQETYQDAYVGRNSFKIFETSYKEHPIYQDEEWLKCTRENMGDRHFLQEVEGKFILNTG